MDFSLGYEWLGFLIVAGLTLVALLIIIVIIVALCYGITHPDDTTRQARQVKKDLHKSLKDILKELERWTHE